MFSHVTVCFRTRVLWHCRPLHYYTPILKTYLACLWQYQWHDSHNVMNFFIFKFTELSYSSPCSYKEPDERSITITIPINIFGLTFFYWSHVHIITINKVFFFFRGWHFTRKNSQRQTLSRFCFYWRQSITYEGSGEWGSLCSRLWCTYVSVW